MFYLHTFISSFFSSADICVAISESVLSPHITALDEHNKLSTKDQSWRKSGKGQAKHSLKGEMWLHIYDFQLLFSLPSRNTIVFSIFFVAMLDEIGADGWIFLLFTLSTSFRVYKQRQATSVVDNYLSPHMSVSVSPKPSTGSVEETTIPLLFLHLHIVMQTLLLTTHIVWYTSENHRMQVWHYYSY